MLKRAIDCKGNIIGHDITAIKGREQKFNVVDGIAFEKAVTPKAEPKQEVEVEKESIQEGSLEERQAKYLERFEKEVPARYKNDVEWIMKKVTE